MNFLKLLGVVVFVGIETLVAGGAIVGWGNNSSLRFAGIPSSAYTTGIVHVVGVDSCSVKSVSGGRGLALCDKGEVHGWLFYDGGIPKPPDDLREVIAIAAGGMHGIALKRDGNVVQWGNNTSDTSTLPEGLSNIIAIAAGFEHSLALRKDGIVIGWGRTRISSGLSNIVAIAATQSWDGSNLGVKNDGTVIEWNNRGGSVNYVSGLSNVIAVACGLRHSLALKSDGTVFGWGFNGSGEATGSPTTIAPYRASGLVTIKGAVLSNVVAIAASDPYNLGLLQDGSVVEWGTNALGLGAVPSGLSNIVSIAASGGHCLAITTNAAVAERFRH